jgi:hypothetical protein
MCGRFTVKMTWAEIVALYRLTLDRPPHNLQPTVVYSEVREDAPVSTPVLVIQFCNRAAHPAEFFVRSNRFCRPALCPGHQSWVRL